MALKSVPQKFFAKKL